MGLPLIPMAVGLASEFLPGLVRHLGGDKAGEVAETITETAKTVTGAASPEEAAEILRRDAEKQRALKQKLAEYELQLETTIAADRRDARELTETLAKERRALAWSAPFLSAIILVAFGVMVYVVVVTPAGGNSQVAQILLGALASMAVQVTNFWLGSSRSSQEKTALLTGGKRFEQSQS